VLTAKEVYESKLAYIKAKEKKKKDLEDRKRAREMAKQSKVKGSAKKSAVSAPESPAVKEVGLKRNFGNRKRKRTQKQRTEDSDDKPLANKLHAKEKSNTKEKPCEYCSYVYGDECDPRKDDEWIGCACGKWFHESCAECCGVFEDQYFLCKDCV